MSDVPEWLQRIRRQAYGSSRDAPRPRPPVQAQEPPPFPFPMRQEPEPDWERERREQRPPTGSVIGGMVGAFRPPPRAPQRQPQEQVFPLPFPASTAVHTARDVSRGDQSWRDIPVGAPLPPQLRATWGDMTNAGGDLMGHIVSAPFRGDGPGLPPQPAPQPEQPRLGPPSAYLPAIPPPSPFPFPIYRPGSTGTPFAEVQDTGPPPRDPPPQRTPYMASRFAPPSAMTPQEEAVTIAEAESAAVRTAIERARQLRGSRAPLPTLEEIQRREDGAALAVRGYDPARGGTRRGRGGGGGGGDRQERGGGW